MGMNSYLRQGNCAVAMIVVSLMVMGGAVLLNAGDTEKEASLLVDSFEEGTKAPEGWSQGASIPGVTYVWEQKQASDGKRSLGFRKTAKRYFPIAAWSRTLERTGDKPALRVAANVKAKRATKAVIDVVFLDDKGEWIKHEWAAFIGQKEQTDPVAHHDWKPYAGAVAIPPQTSQIVIGLQMYGQGEVWFDELDVTYADGVDENP